MNTALQQLSGNQEKFGKNLNQNLKAIRAAFEFSDAHFNVYREALNDYVMGNIHLKKEGETVMGIDWDWYYAQYTAKMKAEVAEEPEASEAEEPADDFTFGGDYADQNSAASPEDPADEQGHREELDGGRDEADEVCEVRTDGGA